MKKHPQAPVMATIPDAVLNLDQALFELVSNVDILDAVAPTNYAEQRALFFEQGCAIEPKFLYSERNVDTFALSRALFNLKVEAIEDKDLRYLYTAVINSYVDRVNQFKSIGSLDFLYESLRYYGEPSGKDIRNAHFVLHLPCSQFEANDNTLDANQIGELMTEFAAAEGYEFELVINKGMIANALVSGTRIKINSEARINEIEARALAHHEVGVHLVTTLNARNQPLKVLRLGCPVNTMTQEGLAILCEYLAGCQTVDRLRILALRVLAVESMLKEKRFRHTFEMLHEQYKVPKELAFTITARVFRGGGFTKDYLYLKGFHKLLNVYENSQDIETLLIGKTSLRFLPQLNRLIEKGFLLPPKFVSPAIRQPTNVDGVMQFVAHAIK